MLTSNFFKYFHFYAVARQIRLGAQIKNKIINYTELYTFVLVVLYNFMYNLQLVMVI
jgi:hypothetical protein